MLQAFAPARPSQPIMDESAASANGGAAFPPVGAATVLFLSPCGRGWTARSASREGSCRRGIESAPHAARIARDAIAPPSPRSGRGTKKALLPFLPPSACCPLQLLCSSWRDHRGAERLGRAGDATPARRRRTPPALPNGAGAAARDRSEFPPSSSLTAGRKAARGSASSGHPEGVCACEPEARPKRTAESAVPGAAMRTPRWSAEWRTRSWRQRERGRSGSGCSHLVAPSPRLDPAGRAAQTTASPRPQRTRAIRRGCCLENRSRRNTAAGMLRHRPACARPASRATHDPEMPGLVPGISSVRELFARRLAQRRVDAVLPAGPVFLEKIQDVAVDAQRHRLLDAGNRRRLAGRSAGLVVTALKAFSAAVRRRGIGPRAMAPLSHDAGEFAPPGHRLNKPMISAFASVAKCRLKPTTAAEVSAATGSLSVFTANTVNR